MEQEQIDIIVSKMAYKYYKTCKIDVIDLKQELLLEYFKLIEKKSFIEKKLDSSFNEQAYINKSLYNRCLKIQKENISNNNLIQLDDNLDNKIFDFSYSENFNSEKNIRDAIDKLDIDSKKYVIIIGYLNANLDFLKQDFDNITKNCSEEDLNKVIDKPTDVSIAKYIFHQPVYKITYIHNKIRKNKEFINSLL